MRNRLDESTTAKFFPCPVCRTSTRYDTGSPYRPFCSRRCKMIDLGQWLEEDYRVCGDPAPHDQLEDQ